jgi:hypothetical protein
MFDHPKKVCMSYFKHMKLSFYFSYLFTKGAIKSLIHGLYPDIFITSTTEINQKVKKLLEESGCR